VLYLVACGARTAADAPRAVDLAHTAGLDVAVIPTPAALRFIGDTAPLAGQTGYPVRSDYKRPDEPDALPPADAFLVSPLTFNSLNKWAAGVSDTLATGLLNEALGLGVPIVAVPWVNAPLSRHPAAPESVARLAAAGVEFTSGFGHPSATVPGPDGAIGTPDYPWDEIEAQIARIARVVRR
jgi:phosphopantothenoylcysteine synthetase/decarboxylase